MNYVSWCTCWALLLTMRVSSPVGASRQVCSGVSALSKIYPPRSVSSLWSWTTLKKPDATAFSALQDITVNFSSNAIVSFVGPSGSGKSTLAKVISGREGFTSGVVLHGSDATSFSPDDPLPYEAAYLDHLFSLTYSSSSAASKLIPVSSIWMTLYLQQGIDPTTPVQQLLESQRKVFEILLSLHRSSRNDHNQEHLLVLDEYLDKDVPSVRKKVIEFLELLTTKSLGNVKAQVVIITHSKGVMETCSQFTVVLSKGRLYSTGHPSKVMIPAQMTWLP